MTDYLAISGNNLDQIYDTTNYVVSSEMNQFYKFIIDNKIFHVGIAFIVSNQVTDLFQKFMKDIISPILARLIGSEEEKLEHIQITIFGIKFDIGNFVLSLLHFIIVILVLFYIVRLLPENIIVGKNI